MSLNARFSADFTEFDRAIDKAQVNVTAFQRGTQNAARDLARLGESFSGQKIIADATRIEEVVSRLGGASKLTEAEQARVNRTVTEAIQKYQVLGLEAPSSLMKLQGETTKAAGLMETLTSKIGPIASALGIAFGGREIIQAIGGLVDYGDALDAMSTKTGVSVESLQVLDHIAKQSNTSLESMTGAINDMEKRLGSGEASAAVRTLGLDMQQLLAMKPDQAYGEIASALGRVAQQSDKADLAQQVLGRGWQEVGATLVTGYKDLERQVSESMPKISAQQAQSLAEVKKLWEGFWADLKTEAAVGAAHVIEDFKKVGDEFVLEGQVFSAASTRIAADIELPVDKSRAAADALITHQKMIADGIQHLRDDYYEPLTDTVKDAIRANLDYGATHQQLKDWFGVTEGSLQRLANEWRAQDDELKKWNEDQKQLAEAGAAIWQKFQQDTRQATAEAVAGSTARHLAYSLEYLDLIKLKKAAEDNFLAMTGQAPAAGGFTQQQDAINQDYDAKIAAARAKSVGPGHDDEQQQYIQELERERAFKLSALAINGPAPAATAGLSPTHAGAVAAGSPRPSFGGNGGGVAVGGGVINYDDYGNPYIYIPGVNQPGHGVPRAFAEGGIATRPTFGVFGERGPEALIPLNKSGFGGGQPVVVNISMSGLLVSANPAAKAELQRWVKDAAMAGVNRKFSLTAV